MKALRRALPFLVVTLGSVAATAQPAKRHVPAPPPTVTATGPTNLRAHVGTDRAARLLRSLDPDERIRGVERASRLGSPEALTLLVESLEKSPQIKSDTRALLAMARGLAPYAEQERARVGLQTIIGAGSPGIGPARVPASARGAAAADALEEGDPIARAELAREVAAIALARWGGDRGLEALYGAARGGGIGQNAALLALGIHPPRDPGFFGTPGTAMPASVVRMLGRLGDLRALDVLHAATRSSDVGVRSAALVALAELGDGRAGPLARAAIVEGDARLRAASGEVFVLLGAPERFKATTALLSDEATTAIGIHLAERVHDADITKLVAARAAEHPDRQLRVAAIRALGTSPDPNAAKALLAPSVLVDRELTYDALLSLARSPAPNAGALIAALFPTRLASLAARAYIVRALVRGERSAAGDAALSKLASSGERGERALGVLGRVALGEVDGEKFLDDKAPQVRRAAAAGAMARPWTKEIERALLSRLAAESDPTTRQAFALGLRGGDPEGLVKTSVLIERAESGAGDAPLAAAALARRADDATIRRVAQLLGSKDPLLRAHTARGLALASRPDTTGRLADAYAYETEADVRRALIEALAARTGDASAPARAETLAIAAELDPDGAVRQAARRALAGAAVPFAEAAVHEVAWLRLTVESGGPPDASFAFAGSVVRSDGLAVPVSFDAEGYALVPGLPPGESRLVLAPRLPTDKAPTADGAKKP